jgi:hypothetical protein
MNFFMNFFHGLQSLFQKRRVDRELDEELAAFAEASAADKQRASLSPQAALRAARIEIASTGSVKYRVWSSRWESIPDVLFRTCVSRYGNSSEAPALPWSRSSRSPWASAPTLQFSRCLTLFCYARYRSRSPRNCCYSVTADHRAAPAQFPMAAGSCSPILSSMTFVDRTPLSQGLPL